MEITKSKEKLKIEASSGLTEGFERRIEMEYKIIADELYEKVVKTLASERLKTKEEIVKAAFERGLVILAREHIEELDGGDANL